MSTLKAVEVSISATKLSKITNTNLKKRLVDNLFCRIKSYFISHFRELNIDSALNFDVKFLLLFKLVKFLEVLKLDESTTNADDNDVDVDGNEFFIILLFRLLV